MEQTETTSGKLWDFLLFLPLILLAFGVYEVESDLWHRDGGQAGLLPDSCSPGSAKRPK